MPMPMRPLLVVVLLLSCASLFAADSKEERARRRYGFSKHDPKVGDVHWLTEDQATAEAKRTGLPVMVCVNMDGENTNDMLASSFYRSPEFVRRARSFVCVLANRARHEEIMRDGRKVCARFGTLPCDTHALHWRSLTIVNMGTVPANGSFTSPQHYFYKVEGDGKKWTTICGKVYFNGKGELFGLMDQAERAALPDVKKRLSGYLSLTTKADLDTQLPRLRPIQQRALFELFREKGSAAQRDLVGKIAAGPSTKEWRAPAIRSLGVAGNDDAVAALSKAATDRNADIRRAALEALYAIGTKATWPVIGSRLDRERDAELRALLLGRVSDDMLADAKVRAALTKVLSREKAPDAKLRLIARLGPLAAEDANLMSFFLKQRKKERDPSVRAALWWAIGYGKPDERTLAALQKDAEREKPKSVREAAKSVLKRLAGDEVKGYDDFVKKLLEKKPRGRKRGRRRR